MFVYQPNFTTLELKVNKSTEYAIGQNSKDLYKSKLLPLLHGAFLSNIKYLCLKLDNTILVVEQKNYATKTISDLDNWQKYSAY